MVFRRAPRSLVWICQGGVLSCLRISLPHDCVDQEVVRTPINEFKLHFII